MYFKTSFKDNSSQVKFLLALLLGFFSLGLRAQFPEKPEDISPLLIGEQVPALVLRTATGAAVKTESLFAGKRSILIFYRADGVRTATST